MKIKTLAKISEFTVKLNRMLHSFCLFCYVMVYNVFDSLTMRSERFTLYTESLKQIYSKTHNTYMYNVPGQLSPKCVLNA